MVEPVHTTLFIESLDRPILSRDVGTLLLQMNQSSSIGLVFESRKRIGNASISRGWLNVDSETH